MDDDFEKSVESGLKLAKRIYNGKDRYVSVPTPVAMEKSSPSHQPTAPMFYAVISDPGIVDNPDIPSYQPYVHGPCDPPALIPLHLNEIGMESDCYLDTAFITIRGTWRLHCVMGSRSCDCRLVVPLGEQGSILGVEVDVAGRSYSTQLIQMEETHDLEKMAKHEHGGFLKPQMFSLTIPQVDGGSILSIKVSWSQKLLYTDGQFSLSVPFNFPEYVNPSGKRYATAEKIQLNVNTGIAKEVICKTTSHPLKEIRRKVGKLGFIYEEKVMTWSTTDFCFSYVVTSNDIFGGMLLQSPSIHDDDQREMFYLYLFPGNMLNRMVFRKQVIFLVDISGSMRGKPLENAKEALGAALSKFTPSDSFSIIAFNEETRLFSSSLELANKETVENATQWISGNFVAGGDTNILQPLDKAMEMLSEIHDPFSQIFLITDGAVEDEHNICNTMKTYMASRGHMSPRISTFGIGSYCNHYFLRMLALIGRGQYDAAYDADSINVRMQRFFAAASSAILTNITIDIFDHLDGIEMFAKRQIDMFTAQAWFSESKQLEEKVTKLSMQSGVPSEYTCMVLIQSDKEKHALESTGLKEVKRIDSQKNAGSKEQRVRILLRGLNVGFGNVTATMENLPTGFGESDLLESEIAIAKALQCCSRMADCCCCLCCVKMCSKLNSQCVIALTQLCTALSCFGCLSCCVALCCPDSN
ncbi:uncharacterized protein LOC143877948 isoform X2 [Tasmannia lanceolata]|uniref:uncharacterized protein LOC143877948 isoform X2 n=1 Tax=Tasmannia lanceolata TaxID=3420 RepID=UPI0040647D6C